MHIQDSSCAHALTTTNGYGMVACVSCRSVEWWTPEGRADAHLGMAAAFGNFDQVAQLRAISSEALGVTVYSPATRDDRTALATLPVRVWLEVHPTFWIASDGHHLLISVSPGAQSESEPASRPTLQLVPAPS
jgi:hypothetical protein